MWGVVVGGWVVGAGRSGLVGTWQPTIGDIELPLFAHSFCAMESFDAVAGFISSHQLSGISSDAKECETWVLALLKFGLTLTKTSIPVHQFNLQIRKHYGMHVVKRAIQIYLSDLCTRWIKCEDKHNVDAEDDDELIDEDAEEETAMIRALLIEEILSLQSMGWHVLYSAEILEVLQLAIDSYVHELCAGDYETKFLPQLQTWLEMCLFKFACKIFVEDKVFEDTEVEESKKSNPTTDGLWSQFSHWLLKALSLLRATELFDIVADFPDSMNAVREFKDAISASNCLGPAGKIFRGVVHRRLLHTGASTGQIIDMYIGMIRTLRIIDSSDLLLNYVAAPVRTYLRGRKDTVRCVVVTLLQGKSGELHLEMRRGRSLEYGPDEDDEDCGAGAQWEPRKRDPDLIEGGNHGRGLDALALLISIYGSTDLFVTDYRSVLADKLMSNLDYRADAEMATLELLKIRFGEDPLHACEVMLRDLDESRRVNVAVHKGPDNGPAAPAWVDFLIMSVHYWPALAAGSSELTLHRIAQDAIKEYSDTFSSVKKPRHLTSASLLGTVDLSLDFNDGSTRFFRVSPPQASLILFLADATGDDPSACSVDGCLSLTQLAKSSNLEEAEAHRYMAYWVHRGVVRKQILSPDEGTLRNALKAEHEKTLGRDQIDVVPDYIDPFSDPFDDGPSGSCIIFSIDEEQSERAAADAKRDAKKAAGENEGGDGGEEEEDEEDDDDAGAAIAKAAAAVEKATIATCEGYVRGVLTGHGSMELERLHTMLKLLMNGEGGSSEAKFEMTVVTFKKFLGGLVQRDVLEQDSGVYRLRK